MTRKLDQGVRRRKYTEGVPQFCNRRVFSALGLGGAGRVVLPYTRVGGCVINFMSEIQELEQNTELEKFNLEKIPSARLHELRDEIDFLTECADNYQERLNKSFTNNID